MHSRLRNLTNAAPGGDWRPLFDGKSLARWRESDFFGAGKVAVENGVIQIGFGALTGINWGARRCRSLRRTTRSAIEAAKIKGSDFFAGITFPVGDSFCTWINGGWGGEVVGLSSINGADAAHNETTFSRKFDPGHWYTLRLRVTASAIAAWIDDELAFDVAITGKWIALREGEIEQSVPFGIAAYSTVAAVRKIDWRPVEPARLADPLHIAANFRLRAAAHGGIFNTKSRRGDYPLHHPVQFAPRSGCGRRLRQTANGRNPWRTNRRN